MFEQIALIGVLLAGTIRLMIPILLGSIGEAISQKSGVLNIPIEGYMLIGAFTSYFGSYITGNPWLGVLLGVAVAGLFSLFNALMCVRFHRDQIVTGLATWFVITGLTGYIFFAIFKAKVPKVASFESVPIPLLVDIPIIGRALFNQPVITYIMLILVAILHLVLFKTTFGLNIRAVGDSPFAADVMGINVYETRYLAALISGLTSGLAGAYLSLGVIGIFSLGIIAGRGFVVLALVTFGRGKPLYILIGSFIFSAVDYLQLRMRILGFGVAEAWLAMPYIITILILAFTPERGMVSKTINIPYVREKRE